MTRQQKHIFLKFAVILAIVPVAIRAYEFGPDPRYTGAPGDQPSCLAGAGCHIQGSFGLNKGPGSVQIKLAGAASYTPGVKQRIQVVVTDSTKQKFGFQLTARLASNLSNGQAGDFSTVDGFTQVVCDDSSSKANGKSCPAAFPVQFIEHTRDGYTASTSGGYTYNVDWTPPETNAGNITLFVAANSGPGGAPVQTGANVYTSSLTVTPAAATTGPTIGAVQNGTTFQATALAPNMFATIKGTGLATNTRIWLASDFANGNKPPISLDGTSVTVNGTAAFIYYISPTQINFITPNITATGNGIPVVATLNGSASAAATITIQATAPSLFSNAPGTADDLKYAIAQHYPSYSLVGKNGLYPTAPTLTTPAKAGELVILYGTGFGPTNPALPPGVTTDTAALYVANATVTVGGLPASGTVFLLAGGYQVYQMNLTLPANLPPGDQPIVATVNGIPSVVQMITVQ